MRYPVASANPAEPTYEVDDGFMGLNMKLERSKLPPGYYSRGINKRCRDQVARKRGGSILPKFCNTASYGSIVGEFIYSDPRGPEQMLIATPTKVWRHTDGGYPQEITLPAGVTLAAPVRFAQLFDRVLLTRGTGANDTILQWAGTATTNFEKIAKKDSGDTSTMLIPNVERIVSFADRALFPFNRTHVGVSDIGDYSSYDPILADYLLNLGTSDIITRLYPFARATLIVGKETRIERVTGLDNPATARLDVVSDSVGTCAWDSWAMVGGDPFFLSRPGGVYRIAEVIQERLETNPVPVSDPIEPLIKRINWAFADGAVAAVQGFYYYLAVPLDGSEVNNALLVYNTVSKNWESCDVWDAACGMQIDALLRFDYQGSKRMYAVNRARASVHLLEEGKFDESKTQRRHQIADDFITRAYATRGAIGKSQRDYKRLEVTLETWWPSITVSALTERANDERALVAAPITKSPRVFMEWDHAHRDVENPDDDQNAAGLEDYSVTLPIDPGSGIEVEKRQEYTIDFAPQIRSRAVALRFQSTAGDCDISSVMPESAGLQRTIRRAA